MRRATLRLVWSESCAFGVFQFSVGQDEQPLAEMRRADFLRAKDSFLNLIAKSEKFSSDLFISDAQMVFDVFEEDDFWLNFADDPRDVRPEMTRIFRAALFPGTRERLAGVARSEDIHSATPRFASEGFEIAPNRCLIEGSVLHTRNQLFDGSCFVFHETDRASLVNRQSEAEIDSPDSGTEGQNVDGR
jgi:hypothetical protein